MDEKMEKAFEQYLDSKGRIAYSLAEHSAFNAGWEAQMRSVQEAVAAGMPKHEEWTACPCNTWEEHRPYVTELDVLKWVDAKHSIIAKTSRSPHWRPDEHLPTLEGVIDYLERQNEQAFLAYRRLERGSEPGMNKDVRIRLMEYAYEQWQATSEALHKAKEAAKNPGPGVTYIDTIQGMLDRHFGASK